VDKELATRLGRRELGFKEAAQKGAFRPLGEGDLDLGRLLEVLERDGYSGWYVLEQDLVVASKPPEGEGPLNEARKSLRFLQTALEGSRER
jgi:inosose dehydratase